MIDMGISFTAQPITVHPYDRDATTHRLAVGNGAVSININHETARQWIVALQTINEKDNNA